MADNKFRPFFTSIRFSGYLIGSLWFLRPFLRRLFHYLGIRVVEGADCTFLRTRRTLSKRSTRLRENGANGARDFMQVGTLYSKRRHSATFKVDLPRCVFTAVSIILRPAFIIGSVINISPPMLITISQR